jgi:hypothetical protein
MVVGSATGIRESIRRTVSRIAEDNRLGSPVACTTRCVLCGPQTSLVWGKYISASGGCSGPHCITSSTTPTTRAR